MFSSLLFFFFFHATATTEIYTLSLHDALPIYRLLHRGQAAGFRPRWRARRTPGRLPRAAGSAAGVPRDPGARRDRKSTRLNSSHTVISYAVFCLKKKTRTLLREENVQ